jgi:hypothetical protein
MSTMSTFGWVLFAFAWPPLAILFVAGYVLMMRGIWRLIVKEWKA